MCSQHEEIEDGVATDKAKHTVNVCLSAMPELLNFLRLNAESFGYSEEVRLKLSHIAMEFRLLREEIQKGELK